MLINSRAQHRQLDRINRHVYHHRYLRSRSSRGIGDETNLFNMTLPIIILKQDIKIISSRSIGVKAINFTLNR